MASTIIIASLASLAIGFIIGYLSKGININITKPETVEVDEEGKVKYNDSLASLLPKHILEEIDRINRG